jgi:hypothetical protein
MRAIALLLGTTLLSAPAAGSGAAGGWPERKAAAVEYVQARAGMESFALVDERGRLRGYRPWRVVRTASLLKPMLLVAYLNRPAVRVRELTRGERRLLGPMIRRSANWPVPTIVSRVGPTRLAMLARRTEMVHFRLGSPWGWSETTAGDQARFFYRIDRYVTPRHRAYARRLLASIVPSQRWGIPAEAPSGWTVFFKGAWSTGTGEVTHQAALLQNGRWRLSLAVLTKANPSHTYGTRTIKGVASRILETPLPFAVE